MVRATNGVATRQRHNKILKRAKGYHHGRRNLIRVAHETTVRAAVYAFIGRQQKKRQYRSLWITRLTAAVRPLGMRYSAFIHGVQKAGIKLNRKELSELAIHDPKSFEQICQQAQKALV